MASENKSHFDVQVNRELFVLGSPSFIESIKKSLAALEFVFIKPVSEINGRWEQLFFVIGEVDFDDTKNMQTLARNFARVDSGQAYKLIYSEKDLSEEHLLFTAELGARFVAGGIERDNELRAFLKRICVESEDITSIAGYESQLAEHFKRRQMDEINKIIDRLKPLAKNNEDVSRLLVIAYNYAANFKRAEFHLKELLRINPQNLWAANTLGKNYLKSGRVAEGIETLRRLSQFHELNAERCLTIGNAYVDAGSTSEAKESFKKGENLTGGEDERFEQGMIKVKLAEGDTNSAIGMAGAKGFSDDVVSFLNMRAIMAMRRGKLKEAMSYYVSAISGVGDDTTKAKLKFNMGLGYIRSNKTEDAETCFKESAELGGKKFDRAKKPLSVVKKINNVKAKKSGQADGKFIDEMSDLEWETIEYK